MINKNSNLITESEIQERILQEKLKGTPDEEIGRKYGVTFRYIEKIITKSQGINISSFKINKTIKNLNPKDFVEEKTTVWSFKQRGNWATHSGEYRGNWSPYIPRNVILKYSKPGELVLDYFCGAGTTAVECKLLGRRCIAFDINEKAIELAKKNIDFSIPKEQFSFMDGKARSEIYENQLLVRDARDLSFLSDNTVDLICSHPPYANIIHYTDSKNGDFSFLDIEEFLNEMKKVAEESFRVLRHGRQCAILIGDTRRKKLIIPLGFKLINVFLNAGFKLRELIIKRQHNCKTTGFWYKNSIKYNFLLLAHEYLPIFEKPKLDDGLSIREQFTDYVKSVSILDKLQLKRKLDNIETSTVWILPEKDFEKILNKNVIDRYSNGKKYSTIFYDFKTDEDINENHRMVKKGSGLLFIKSQFLNHNIYYFKTELYLKKIKEIIIRELPKIIKNGFVVIQARDFRMNNFVEPIAKEIVDMLTIKNICLKEIIIVIPKELRTKICNSKDSLEIVHQYLLVYEIK